jgi:cellulose synthase/poly-beta-1,6-N-acetylglucosamine synthase-like glycosyltransferase
VIEGSFWLAVLFLVYTYVGYPSVVWAFSRLRPSAVARGDITPPVSIILVAYNEEQGIGRKIESCLAQTYPVDNIEIVVASDGSSDQTASEVRQYENRGVRLLAFAERRGKAACINDAVQACRASYIIFSDARQRLDTNAVAALMCNFADLSVGAVSGELVFEDTMNGEFAKGVDTYWKYEKFLRQAEGRVDSVVGATGALYAIRRAYFQPIPAGTILDDVLIPMNIVLQGKRVVFEPTAKVFDVPSPDAASEERRKRRTLAGNYQVIALRPALLNPFKNRLWLQYVSHKVARLLAPLAMLTALTMNVLLAGSSNLYAVLLAVQLLLYGMAFLGILRPAYLKYAVIRIPTTFYTFNWYAVLGFVEFARNRNIHLWQRQSPEQRIPGRTPIDTKPVD